MNFDFALPDYTLIAAGMCLAVSGFQIGAYGLFLGGLCVAFFPFAILLDWRMRS